MNSPLYSFSGLSGEDPIIALVAAANSVHPGFITLVVDGGAGIGSFTDRVVSGSTECEVIAYEPLPENLAILRSRFQGMPAVKIRDAALGDKATDVAFEVPDRQGVSGTLWAPGTTGGGYVSKPGLIPMMKSGLLPIAKYLARKVLRRPELTQLHEIVSVKMVRLDAELSDAPDLIKFDLQGGEPEALDGLGALLRQTKVVKIELLLRGAVDGQGLAKTRCVRALSDAGFSFFIDGLQFAVPKLTDALRRALHQHGVTITYERQINPSQRDITIMGKWPEDRPLPIQTRRVLGSVRAIGLTRDFEGILSEARVSYFAVDLIALNGRYAKQWSTILPQTLLKHSEPELDERPHPEPDHAALRLDGQHPGLV